MIASIQTTIKMSYKRVSHFDINLNQTRECKLY